MESKGEKILSRLDCAIDYRHVDVVDGIRGFSVLLVLWFHFWQQTWLMPSYPTPFLAFMGIKELTPVHIRWVGYLFVDMMVLLSAFCLTLPYARHKLLGEGVDDAVTFYKKRFARIYPSYCLIVLISFAMQVIEGHYGSFSYALRDLLSHLTFTELFRIDTYVFAPINGVLWTVALEAQFYLVFPLLARAFKKSPGSWYVALVSLGLLFIYGYALSYTPTSMVVNQFPAFLPVFANGMLLAFLFTAYALKAPCKKLFGVFFTALTLFAAVLIQRLLVSCYSFSGDKQLWQLSNRYALSLAFSLFILSASLAVKPFRWLFSNKLARFLGGISFNLYMVHQRIMVLLRQSIGFRNGADVSAAGLKMQVFLTAEALAVSVGVAILLTYFVERPCQRWILGMGRKKKEQGAITLDQ